MPCRKASCVKEGTLQNQSEQNSPCPSARGSEDCSSSAKISETREPQSHMGLGKGSPKGQAEVWLSSDRVIPSVIGPFFFFLLQWNPQGWAFICKRDLFNSQFWKHNAGAGQVTMAASSGGRCVSEDRLHSQEPGEGRVLSGKLRKMSPISIKTSHSLVLTYEWSRCLLISADQASNTRTFEERTF